VGNENLVHARMTNSSSEPRSLCFWWAGYTSSLACRT